MIDFKNDLETNYKELLNNVDTCSKILINEENDFFKPLSIGFYQKKDSSE